MMAQGSRAITCGASANGALSCGWGSRPLPRCPTCFTWNTFGPEFRRPRVCRQACTRGASSVPARFGRARTAAPPSTAPARALRLDPTYLLRQPHPVEPDINSRAPHLHPDTPAARAPTPPPGPVDPRADAAAAPPSRHHTRRRRNDRPPLRHGHSVPLRAPPRDLQTASTPSPADPISIGRHQRTCFTWNVHDAIVPEGDCGCGSSGGSAVATRSEGVDPSGPGVAAVQPGYVGTPAHRVRPQPWLIGVQDTKRSHKQGRAPRWLASRGRQRLAQRQLECRARAWDRASPWRRSQDDSATSEPAARRWPPGHHLGSTCLRWSTGRVRGSSSGCFTWNTP